MDARIQEIRTLLAAPQQNNDSPFRGPVANSNNAPKSGNKSGFRQPSFAPETPPPGSKVKGAEAGAPQEPSIFISPTETTGKNPPRGFADTTLDETEEGRK